MKPITFESIRNFIKTKKKNKKDGADTSFKRSDSFKRISIRKSYLDRGRNKRTARTAAAVAAAAAASGSSANLIRLMDDEGSTSATKVNDNPHPVLQHPTPTPLCHEDDASSQHHHHHHNLQNQHHQMARRSLSVVAEQHYSSRDDVNDDLLLKNKSLHEINEICGGSEVVKYDVIVIPPQYHQQQSDSSVVVCGGDIREDTTEVQMVQMNFGESIYDNLAENAEQDDHDDASNHHVEDAYGNHDASAATNTSNDSSYFMLHDNIYERADSISTTCHQTLHGRCGSPTSTNISSLYVNHRDDHPFSDTPSSVTFTTFGEPRIYLETSFDSSEPQSFLHTTMNSTTSSREDNVSRTSLNNRIDIDSHTFKVPNRSSIQHSDGVVIRIPANPPVDPLPFKPAKTTILLNSPAAAELSPLPNDDDDELETSLNGKFTFEIYKELQRSQDSLRPSAHTKSDDLNDQFTSLQLNHPSAFSSSDDLNAPDFYDILPDSTIPRSVRLKINPFTRQKELYSVNLGRIWKQLNLGQDDMSLDGSSMQGNFKKKNESFKSMSSQDSGFSLTLTKPKSPFRGRSKKSRRRAAAVAAVDVSLLQRSARADRQLQLRQQRKTSGHPNSEQHLAGEYGFSGRYNASEFDATLRRTLQRQRGHLRSPEQVVQDENVFLREFEQFCLRRNQMKLVQKSPFRDYGNPSDKSSNDGDEDDEDEELGFADDQVESRPVRDSFTQEINDLEAFFEEHLKRLKDYYLQKKQITEQSVDQICNDHFDDEDHIRQVEEDDHNGEFHSLGRPDSESPPLVQDFNFPHPDKRASSKPLSGKRRTKFHAPEVRCVRHKQGNLNYAALEFPTKNESPSVPKRDRSSYADLQFPPTGSFQSDNMHSADRVLPKTIALSSIFPAANSSTSNPDPRCPTCYGLTHDNPRRNHQRRHRRRRSTTNSVQLTSSSNDEFSEQEFIANSIGLDDCPNCDRTDCDCDNGSGGQWCTCTTDHHNQDDHLAVIRRDTAVTKSRRIVKRKKSKRRSGGGRNHSTLRRCSSYYNTASGNHHLSKSLCRCFWVSGCAEHTHKSGPYTKNCRV